MKQEEGNLEKVEANVLGDWPTDVEHLELCMDKEEYLELLKLFKLHSTSYSKIFGFSLMRDVYIVPENTDFREGFSLLKVYPIGSKNIWDWQICQHIVSKYDSQDVIETPIIALKDLDKHFKGVKDD